MSEEEKRETRADRESRKHMMAGLERSAAPGGKWREKYGADVLEFVDALTHEEYGVWAGYCYSKFKDGGDIVPAEFLAEMYRGRDAHTDMAKRVQIWPVESGHGTMPTGGTADVSVDWDAEGGPQVVEAVKLTSGDFKERTWQVRRVKCLSTLSQNLISDRIVDVVAYACQRLGVGLGEERDKVCFVGEGPNRNQPEGLVHSAIPVDVHPDASPYERCVALTEALAPEFRAGAVWAFPSSKLERWCGLAKDPKLVARVSDEHGDVMFVKKSGAPPELLGRPVVLNDHIPPGVILYGDPKAYMIFDRQKTRISREPIIVSSKGLVVAADALAITATEHYDGKLALVDGWVSFGV